MASMSASEATTATKVRVVSYGDLRLGVAEIENSVAVSCWVRHGKPAGDIEYETLNVIDSLHNRPGYKELQVEICTKYGIDEREFVRQLFRWMKLH
jgi:hypothetical protein